MKHAEVPEALDLVVDEVGKESQRIRDAGSEALRKNNLGPAQMAIEYAKKLEAFVDKVHALGVSGVGISSERDRGRCTRGEGNRVANESSFT